MTSAVPPHFRNQGDAGVESVRIATTAAMTARSLQGVFICVGLQPSTELFRDLSRDRRWP